MGRISTVFFVVLNFLFKERTGLYKYLGRHPIGEKDTNSFTHSHTHTHTRIFMAKNNSDMMFLNEIKVIQKN